MKLDPRSTHVVLAYTGNDAGEPYINGVPARDLTEHDLSVLASRRDTKPEALITELLTGPYRTAPAASGKTED